MIATILERIFCADRHGQKLGIGMYLRFPAFNTFGW